ncbi:ubiquitin carboxyl-terminal hydrolase 26 [Pteropus medius]|uniref:ubiquitin carboxyl-terminal hydrolase 26 n=1 Tax=Pteropus vampyrus TaxID=132908 RepID=UPI00196AD628|nr:ubiquitin carboxyl-terminal hydrolase 26 [Pteropus giganteus]
MADRMIHGFIQIWNKETGMSMSKEALIETVERKKEVRLVAYYHTGECITFQLSNNIKTVVFRSYGEKQNHLHLTFQNNSFLFIKKLSSRDAVKLKMFLDRVHQNNLQPLTRSDRDGDAFASITTQKEVNKTFHEVHKKSSSRPFEIGEGSGTPDLQRMSLYTSKSSTLTCKDLLQNEWRKRKEILSSDSEMKEKFQKKNESVRKKTSNPLRYVRYREREELRIKELKDSMKLEFGPLLETNSIGNPNLDGTTLLQTLTQKIYLALLLKTMYSEDDLEWDTLKMSFESYPEKLWQGLPNLGNTCYMNAVLQSLFSIPSFAYDLLYQDFPWGKIPLDDLNMCLAQLLILKDIYNIKIKEKLLVSIKQTISTAAEIFSSNIQNDAHEFLGHCLDQMKENMKNLNIIWKTKIESEKDNSPQQVFAGNAATKMLTCPVIANFELELLHSIICKACGEVVLKSEVSNYLSTNFPQGKKTLPLSIQSTVDLFFGAEELEYKCGKCNHESSVAVHKFSRLPRVLIVHLKRYHFNEFWSLKKDVQEVIVSKYLKLSSHCNESTKPPVPLSKNAHIMNFQFLKVFQKIYSEILSSLTPSKKLDSESKDSLVSHIRSGKESGPQKCQMLGSSGEQKQKGLRKYSKLNIPAYKFVNSGYDTTIKKEISATGLTRDQEDTNLSVIREDAGKLTHSPGTCPAEVHFQEVSGNQKLKKSGKTNIFVDIKSVTKTTKDFHEDKKNRISEESPKVTEHERMRIYEQALRQALLQSFLKPDVQRYTENLRRPTELSYQEANVNSLGRQGSNKKLGNNDFLDKEKTEPVAKKPKRNSKMGDHYAYRLIGVISHLGNSPNSGHYISDAYDFERQIWFTYNDLQVSSIQEAPMQEARLSTGYIFFYMHNEIFEELLERQEKSKLPSTKAGENSRKK